MRRLSYQDPRHEADRDYRRAWGKRPFGRALRAAFYEYLSDAPTGRYVTREQARRYADQIRDVADLSHTDSDIQWTIYEKRRLRALWIKWDRRARGFDPRFNAIGVQGGVTDQRRARTHDDVVAALRRAFTF